MSFYVTPSEFLKLFSLDRFLSNPATIDCCVHGHREAESLNRRIFFDGLIVEATFLGHWSDSWTDMDREYIAALRRVR